MLVRVAAGLLVFFAIGHTFGHLPDVIPLTQRLRKFLK
jgi:hypothetical protein